MVSAVSPNGPMSDLLREGDRLIKMDGRDLTTMSADDVVGLLRATSRNRRMITVMRRGGGDEATASGYTTRAKKNLRGRLRGQPRPNGIM